MSLFTQCLFAQQDYFIVKGKDTVYCLFKEKNNFSGPNKMRYTLENSEQTRTIRLDSISEYREKSITYVKRLLPKETDSTFVQWIYRGKINFYRQVVVSYGGSAPGMYGGVGVTGVGVTRSERLIPYAAKGNAPLTYISTGDIFGTPKAKKQQLYDLLADYPELLDKFKANDDYTTTDAVKAAILRYNDFFSSARGYYVNQKGDTVNCKIVDKIAASASPDSLAYKTPGATKFKPLALDSIKEYTFLGTVFTRHAVPGTPNGLFMSCEEKGNLNLYQHINANDKKSWYLSKGNGPLTLIKGSGPKKQQVKAFSELIADYPELLTQFSNSDYDETIIRRTIITYNKMKKG
ncbi:MAG: hypothetical protein ABIN91_15730 [Mucilaginibacter sp.]|uniref:hypothetical protein n=1 Tax=Mucilaginibacter sp. TaxID=1882438 RepID=UPI0032634848